MKERILEFLKRENKSSAQFADEIGVQASGISHILSGRNNPSLDFVIKMLSRYPFISADWLLFGKGDMYRDQTDATLFDFHAGADRYAADDVAREPVKNHIPDTAETENKIVTKAGTIQESRRSARIVVFFENGTFTEYIPAEK